MKVCIQVLAFGKTKHNHYKRLFLYSFPSYINLVPLPFFCILSSLNFTLLLCELTYRPLRAELYYLLWICLWTWNSALKGRYTYRMQYDILLILKYLNVYNLWSNVKSKTCSSVIFPYLNSFQKYQTTKKCRCINIVLYNLDLQATRTPAEMFFIGSKKIHIDSFP